MAAAAAEVPGPPEADPLEGIRTFTLNLADMDKGTTYTDFLSELRQYSVERAPFTCRNCPTTPDDGYFIIRLVERDRSIRLLIQEMNGYMIALQRGDHSWFHFKGETPPDFISVFSGNENRCKLPEFDSLWQVYIDCFHVGPEQLRHYFHCILGYNNDVALGTTVMNNQRMALALMSVVFCEARRLRPVKRFVSKCFRNQVSKRLTEGLWKYIHSWSTISVFILAYHDEDGNPLPIIPEDPTYQLLLKTVSACEIGSMRDAVGANGALLLILR